MYTHTESTHGITRSFHIKHIYYHLIFNEEVSPCVNKHLRCNRIRVSARQHESRYAILHRNLGQQSIRLNGYIQACIVHIPYLEYQCQLLGESALPRSCFDYSSRPA